MSYRLYTTRKFEKDIKRLSRKYRGLKNDYKVLLDELENNPLRGIKLFDGIYKIRLKSSDMKKGKSGSFRVIYYVITSSEEVYLLTMYSKGEKEDISREEIRNILREIF